MDKVKSQFYLSCWRPTSISWGCERNCNLVALKGPWREGGQTSAENEKEEKMMNDKGKRTTDKSGKAKEQKMKKPKKPKQTQKQEEKQDIQEYKKDNQEQRS